MVFESIKKRVLGRAMYISDLTCAVNLCLNKGVVSMGEESACLILQDYPAQPARLVDSTFPNLAFFKMCDLIYV